MMRLAAATVLAFFPIATAVSAANAVRPPTASHPSARLSTRASNEASYPIGVPDSSEPSGYSPPSANALPGFQLSYVNDFTGSSLPAGWGPFDGQPGSDPGAQWAPSHVVVSDGTLDLNAWQDPAYGNEWVTGGICQCGVARTYGAYFVRSRLTGPGPTQVELLWPVQSWPPEIDFDETFGGDTSSMATAHFSSTNLQIHRTITIDMTQWHTWGVIWTPTAIVYTVDGRVWGTVTQTTAIPNQPMTLDLQQQTWCSSSATACPTSPESTYIDWVAEYAPESGVSASTQPGATPDVTVGPFAANSWALTSELKSQITSLANKIQSDKDASVSLVGFGDDANSQANSNYVSEQRALAVERYLRQRLRNLRDSSVMIRASGGGSSTSVSSNTSLSRKTLNRHVVALLS